MDSGGSATGHGKCNGRRVNGRRVVDAKSTSITLPLNKEYLNLTLSVKVVIVMSKDQQIRELIGSQIFIKQSLQQLRSITEGIWPEVNTDIKTLIQRQETDLTLIQEAIREIEHPRKPAPSPEGYY